MLIAESGASKINWCLITEKELHHFETEGIRCGHSSPEKIERILKQASNYFSSHRFSKIHFYCSGCFAENRQLEMQAYLKSHFKKANHVSVFSDLHAAAKATLGNKSGLVLIIGTGSVIFNWNGNAVDEIYGGKGFPGGDAAGGADLGLRLINLLQNGAHQKLLLDFEQDYDTFEKVLALISNNHFSASIYGSFAPFVIKYKSNPILSELIDCALGDFLSDLPQNREVENISIVGSIGLCLKNEIKQKLNPLFSSKISFEKGPIEGLIQYYTSKKE